MKKIAVILSLLVFIAGSSCSIKTVPSGKVPPGQAKKVTGSQSAKPYAPGQQKN